MLLCLVVATAASSAAAAAAAPVSYWRFEDAGSPGADSVTTGGVALKPKAAASWAPKAFADGGIVGGYVEIGNTSLAAGRSRTSSKVRARGISLEATAGTFRKLAGDSGAGNCAATRTSRGNKNHGLAGGP